MIACFVLGLCVTVYRSSVAASGVQSNPLVGCPDGEIIAEGCKSPSYCDGTTGRCQHSTCGENLLGLSVDCTTEDAPGCYGLMCMLLDRSCNDTTCVGITVCPGQQYHCDMLAGNLCLPNAHNGFSVCDKPTPCTRGGAHRPANFTHDPRTHPNRGCRGIADAQHTGMCVVMADNRFNHEDLEIASLTDAKEVKRRFQAVNMTTTNIRRLSLLINKAYTVKFNYTFLISNLSQYAGKPGFDRHPAWFKIPYIMDVQRSRPDCEWILWMDSDSYIYMDGHTVTLERYLSTVSVHEASFDYLSHEAMRLRHGGCYAWNHKPHISFVIGMNGIASKYQKGYPGVYLVKVPDYVCTGTFLIRNDKTGRQFMQEWWDPAEASGKQDVNVHKHVHPWEQRVLNTYVLPKFAQNATVYSYHDFGSPQGLGFRHLWGPMAAWRDLYMKHDTAHVMTNSIKKK